MFCMSIVCYIVFIDVFLVCAGITIDTSIFKQNFSIVYRLHWICSQEWGQQSTWDLSEVTMSRISLLLSEAEAKLRPRCNNKDILRVQAGFNWLLFHALIDMIQNYIRYCNACGFNTHWSVMILLWFNYHWWGLTTIYSLLFFWSMASVG